ncbi:hypothetical protein T08_2055 [Trichinella sp. T8]|nr:hypothetical protein T08_2055 [Trichinella sp. T8]
MPDYLKIRLSEGPQKMLCLDNRRTSTVNYFLSIAFMMDNSVVLRILLLMSLKCFCLCLLLCFIGVGSNSPSEGFLDIASRIVYQADTLQPNSHYRNVIHAHREDSENGLRLKLRVIETVCSTERALFIGYVYSYNCPNSHTYSSIKCLLTMNNNRTNIVLACNYLRFERI